MRIMYCLPEMSHPGGIGRVTALKANYFAKKGLEVIVVTSSQAGRPLFFELDSSVKYIDIGVDFLWDNQNVNLIKHIFIRWRKMHIYEKKLKGLILKEKPDIVVSTFNNDSDFLYKFNDGSKKVLEFHFCHDGYKSQLKFLAPSIMKKCMILYRTKKQERIARKYDAFIVLTHEDAIAWHGYSNLHIIPNMLSFESEEVSTCSEKRVIAVGRLDGQKKFDRLIDIWKEVAKKYPDWKLDIFGQGPDEDELKERICKLGLNNIITIHPPTAHIKEEYLRSSILVMTSTYEGLPLTLLEGYACGLPCISYSFKCGPQDIISDGVDGFLVEEGDKYHFVEKVVELIRNDALRVEMGKRAKMKSKNYSLEIIMNKWCNLFEKILIQ